ncbi:MAG TPA: tetratricopeptide repeat protein [Candidatus Binataceae bacterium]|nr:tetratricopeptide repeat protein [Candidatus Binataceae bacterium]
MDRRNRFFTPMLAAVGGALALALAGCHPHSVDGYLDAGAKALKANNLGEAQQDYQQAARLAPDDPRVHLALGDLEIAQQQPDQAVLEYLKVIHLDPHNPHPHLELGDIYFKQDKDLLAEEQDRAAVVLAPSQAVSRVQLAEVFQRQNRLPEAESELRTAIGLNPEDAQAHLAMAKVLRAESNRGPEADAEMATARQLDPTLVPDATPPTTVVASAAPAAPALKPLNKLWKLTHDSDVFQDASSTSSVVGHVRRRGYIHVTGIEGDYLEVKLRNGVVGFVPASVAE